MWGAVSLWLWFAFPWWLWRWAPFGVPVRLLNIFLGKMSFWVFWASFNRIFLLLLSCMNSLYILDINPLSDVWFANILSHSVSYLFLLLIVSLLWRRVLVWCGLTCLFFFNCLCFWYEPVNPFPDQCQGASSLDGMFCVYVLGSSGLKYISRPMFIYLFSVWITLSIVETGYWSSLLLLYCCPLLPSDLLIFA